MLSNETIRDLLRSLEPFLGADRAGVWMVIVSANLPRTDSYKKTKKNHSKLKLLSLKGFPDLWHINS